MGELLMYKLHIQGKDTAKTKVLLWNLLFLIGCTDHPEGETIEVVDPEGTVTDDSFYTADEEQEYEGPVTHSRVKALVKANILMYEHFDASTNKIDGFWLSWLFWFLKETWH